MSRARERRRAAHPNYYVEGLTARNAWLDSLLDLHTQIQCCTAFRNSRTLNGVGYFVTRLPTTASLATLDTKLDFASIARREEKYQLDAVAIVVLRPEDIVCFVPDSGHGFSAEVSTRPRWWLVPTHYLAQAHKVRSKCAQLVRYADVAQFEMTAEFPLTRERLIDIVSGPTR